MKKHVLICGLGILLGFLLNTGVLAAANSSIGRWTIWSKNPALQWEDAFVTGNGKIGSLIAGRPQEERITCVHEELFIRGNFLLRGWSDLVTARADIVLRCL